MMGTSGGGFIKGSEGDAILKVDIGNNKVEGLSIILKEFPATLYRGHGTCNVTIRQHIRDYAAKLIVTIYVILKN